MIENPLRVSGFFKMTVSDFSSDKQAINSNPDMKSAEVNDQPNPLAKVYEYINTILSNSFKNSGVPIFLVSSQGKVNLINQCVIDFLDLTDLYELGSQSTIPSWIIYDENSNPVLLFNGLKLEPCTFNKELKFKGYIQQRSGAKKWGLIIVSPIYNTNKEYMGAQCLITDITELINIEQKLEFQKNTLQVVLENMAHAVIVLDKDRRVIAFNKPYQEILLNVETEIEIGMDFTERIKIWGRNTNQPNEVIEESIRNLHSTEAYSSEYIDLSIDNKPIWVKIYHNPLPDGSVIRTYTDITNIKNAELKSKKNEDNFLTFFNAINELLFVFDLSLNILNVNQTVIKCTGYRFSELVGKSVLMLHPPNLSKEVTETLDMLIKGDKDFCSIPILTKSGELIEVETRVQLGDWDGMPAIFGVCKDVTDRRRSEQLFFHAFQSSISLMAISEIETGKYFKVNDKFLTTLGFTEEEVIGFKSTELGLFVDSSFRNNMVAELKKNNFFYNKELKIRAKSGKLVDGLFSGRIVEILDSRYLYTVMQDISELKMKEQEDVLLSKVLALLNNKEQYTDIIHDIMYLLKEYTQVDAIGIRIKEGIDFPYYEVTGFSKDFLEKEHFLRCQSENTTCLDADGLPRFECICGKVITTQINKSAPFYTDDGSFWTNNALEIEESLILYEPNIRLRGTCINSGYVSIALIPIFAGDEVIGLLQLNDKRKDAFTIDKIHFLEQISKTIGIALDRFRTYSALKDSEEKYRSIIEHSQDGVFIVSNDQFVFVNKALSEILNTPISDLIGNKFIDYVRPEDRKIFMELHYKRLKGENVANQFISNIQNIDGSVSKICRTLVGPTTYHGEPAIMGTIHDITEEKLALELIRNNEQFLQAVLKSSPLGISVRSKSGKLLLYNSAWQRIWAIPDEDINMDLSTERVNFKLDTRDDYSKQWWDDITSVYKFGGTLLIPEVKTSGRRKSSAEWISQYFYAIPDIKGEVDRVVVITQDISERKRHELALRESEEHYTVLLDSISKAGICIIMLMTDENGIPIIHYSNYEFAKLLGYTQSEIIGKSIITFIKQEFKELTIERYSKRLKGMEISDLFELFMVNKDGKFIPIEAVTTLSKYQNQTVTVSLIRDMSERKNIEAERIKLSKLESLGVLAGGIAHDFNNLLAAILGYTNLLQLEASEEDIEYLDNIEKAIQQASRLTHQLLTFAKGGDPVKKLSHVEELIRRESEFALLGSNIKTELECIDPWLVDIDPGQIAQVIQNIVINAKQSMQSGGTIFIKTQNSIVDGKRFLMISIKDQGMGISQEYISRIFDPYFSTKQSGSGLGLAICHSIISKHNGKITVESLADIGSTFYIWLPASNQIELAPSLLPLQLREVDYSHLQILIMDDDDFIRDFLVRSFERFKCNVITSKNGEEAIRLYTESLKNNRRFDFVILDLTIPGGMGGIETVSKLLEIDPSVVAIAASGYATDPVMANYKQYGFSYAIGKPFKVQNIFIAISDLLNKIN